MWRMLSIIPLSNHTKASVLVMLVSLLIAAFLSVMGWFFYPNIRFWTHYQNNLKIVMTVDIALLSLSLVFMWAIYHIIFN